MKNSNFDCFEIQIVENHRQGPETIHVKPQFPGITLTGVIRKKSRKLKKFELQYFGNPNSENHYQDPWVTHTKISAP